jgi:putative transposase
VRRKLAQKYGHRRQERIRQILNLVSKFIVTGARAKKQVIVFEDIRGIRKLYRKGSGQGRDSEEG